MALPDTRDLTYAAGVPVSSANLNAIQDSIIGGKFGPRIQFFPAVNVNAGAFTLALPPNGATSLSGSGQGLAVPLTFANGTSITGARGTIVDVSGTTVRVGIYQRVLGSSVVVNTFASAASLGNGTLQTLSIPFGNTIPVVTGHTYFALFVIASGAGACPIFGIEVDTRKG